MSEVHPFVIAIVQARLTSQRLPGKVLLPIGPWSMLEVMHTRLLKARSLRGIVYAVPDSRANDRLAAYIEHTLKAHVVRGSEDDVLTRYMGAIRAFPAEYYLRLTADCQYA